MSKDKETTIDDLAMMVQRGFQSMDQRFDGIDKRFDGVEGRVSGLESRMSNVERQLDVLQRGQVHIEDRLDEIAPQIREHEKRITVLEKKVVLAR